MAVHAGLLVGAKETAQHGMTSFRWRSEISGRRLRFKGAVAAIGAAVGVPDGGRAVAVRNTLFLERTSVVR